MRIKNWIALMSAISLALIVLANTSGPAAWASPGNAPLGQTVPTRTATPSPAQPTVPPESQATPVPAATAAPTVDATPAVLPVAGGGPKDGSNGGSNDGLAVLGLTGLSALTLAWAVRRGRVRA